MDPQFNGTRSGVRCRIQISGRKGLTVTEIYKNLFAMNGHKRV